jgi:stage II sporulation protein D
MTPLLLLALAAAPLHVRVLERERPTQARLEARTLACDGRPVGRSAVVTAGERALVVDGAACNEVTASGEVAVSLPGLTRRFPGALHVTRQGAGLRLVNEVDVEDYLPAVVAAELGDGKPAAQQAQAVVSRTFALTATKRHGADDHDVCDLAHCQVYRGLGEVTPEARQAVAATRGQVLLVGGVALKPVFFHAACGGHTSRGLDVFGEPSAGPGVSDVEGGAPRCAGSAEFTWDFVVERAGLARALGVSADGAAFEPLRRDAAGRVLELRSFGRRLSGATFLAVVGRAFGYQSLRSMKVSAQETEGLVRFHGAGLGHGVGLCQHGARALAERGVDARGILLRYFPDSQARAP